MREAIIEQLKTVFDPEIPVNIYELGLIYDVSVADDGKASIRMTLTTPMCPAAEELPPEAQNMEVLLAVAQEDMINAHVDTLFRAGLDPVALDVEPLAAGRSLIDINRESAAGTTQSSSVQARED